MIVAAGIYSSLRGIPLLFSFLVVFFAAAVCVGVIMNAQRQINASVAEKAKNDAAIVAAKREAYLLKKKIQRDKHKFGKDMTDDQKKTIDEDTKKYKELKKKSEEKISVRDKSIETITKTTIAKIFVIAVSAFLAVTVIAAVFSLVG